MMTTISRELWTFARDNGYQATTCPACAGEPPGSPCPNCGGTGRLWTSPRGSLSDAGLLRLSHLLLQSDR